jgi:phage terminase large subunit GpA-like protein
MIAVEEIRDRALAALRPPPRLRLSDWIEAELRLPEGTSALPGRVRLFPFPRGIADAISDPLIERITLVKPARLGFTTLLTAAIGAYVANEPCAVLCAGQRSDRPPGQGAHPRRGAADGGEFHAATGAAGEDW